MTDELSTAIKGLELRQPPRTPGPGMPVVSVLDDFSEQCFMDAAQLWPVLPASQPVDLDSINPAFILVESAWNGNRGAWRYLVTSSVGPRPPLVKLVEEARKRGIPTVFWNKEDPPHFEDFAPAAVLFDHIFTTEASLVDRYQAIAPHAKVGVLKFAASSRIHRPARVDGHRQGEVCFAGQYFRHKYPERREQMDFLFAAAAEFDFSIYSRMLGGQEQYAFPPQFERFIVGSLPYAQMVEEYKRHKVFLNVNSAPDSQSMCARRVFELAASKTVVLSSRTPAIRSVYTEDEVPMASSTKEAHEVLAHLLGDETARAEMAHRAWRRTAREHTYEDRMEQIRRSIGLPDRRGQVGDTVVLTTPAGLPHEALDRLAAELQEQQLPGAHQVVWDPSEPQWQTRRSSTLAALEEKGIRLAPRPGDEPDWWGAWHPGVTHGGHYLEDMLLTATRFADQQVVAADPDGGALGPDDSVIDRAHPAAWLASKGADGLPRLLEAASVVDPRPVTGLEAYLASGVEVRTQRGGKEQA